MDLFEGHRSLPRRLRRPAVAIGNFDGVHLGHQQLMAVARQAARARDGEAVVLTFDPHPARVLAPELAPPLLTTRARKLELLDGFGMDACVVEPFDRTFAAQSPAHFVQDLLVEGLGAKDVVVGWDFTYGQKRAGTLDTLRAAGATHGFAVHVVQAVTVDGLVASSTKVREFVSAGNMAGARLLLGRDFDVDGEVVRGAGRGRGIGVPTANVAAEGEVLPRPGIYAARVRLPGGEWKAAAVSLGTNPTFVAPGSGGLTLEAHLLDFEGDLYGARVRVAFVARLRDERRFAGVDELVAQIHRDIEEARQRLSHAHA